MKMYIFIISTILFTIFYTNSFSLNLGPQLTIPSITGVSGNTVKIPLYATLPVPAGSFMTELSYDPTVLQLVSIAKTNANPTWYIVSNPIQSGDVVFGGFDESGIKISGSNKLIAVMTFNIATKGKGTTLTLSNGQFDNQPYGITYNDGTFHG